MEVPAHHDDSKKKIAAALEVALELKEKGDEEWTEISVDHQELRLWSLDTSTSRLLKVVGLVRDAHPELLFRDVFGQNLEEKRRLGQDFLLEDHEIEKVEHEHDLVLRRQVYKLVWPMSHRESVCARGGKALGDGRYLQWETSISHPDYPEQSSVVRTAVHLACFFFEPHPDEHTTEVTYIANVEIGGSVPKWIVNLASTKACDRLLSFRRIAQEKCLKL